MHLSIFRSGKASMASRNSSTIVFIFLVENSGAELLRIGENTERTKPVFAPNFCAIFVPWIF
jgi:hypothetical protein